MKEGLVVELILTWQLVFRYRKALQGDWLNGLKQKGQMAAINVDSRHLGQVGKRSGVSISIRHWKSSTANGIH